MINCEDWRRTINVAGGHTFKDKNGYWYYGGTESKEFTYIWEQIYCTILGLTGEVGEEIE